MTFIQDKKSIFMCEECLSPHGQRRAGQKAELGSEQHCPHLFQTVSSTVISNRPSNPVWFGMIHCSPSLALIVKCLFFTKLPLTEKKKSSLIFLLVVSFCFCFFSKKKYQLKNHIEGLPQWYSG